MHELADAFGTFLAGLGLFFVGLKSVGASFKRMAGRPMRLLAAKWTRNAGLAGLTGALFAGVTQSVTPVTFIVVSLVTSGLVEARRAMPMIIWAGVGTSLMVFLSVLNIKLLILYLIGLAGVCLYFEKPRKAQHALHALLGIGMLFYGLQLMRSGAATVESWPEFKSALAQARSALILIFLACAAASIIVQSMAAVSILVITFAKTGLFTLDQAMIGIYGACFGSGLRVWLLSTGLKGSPRQMALLQTAVCGLGGLCCFLLYYLEQLSGWPILKALSISLFAKIEKQTAAIYFCMNLIAALGATAMLPVLQRLLGRLSPPTSEEDLSKPQFLQEQALLDGESAIELVACEQERLFQRLPVCLAGLRESSPRTPSAAILQKANDSLSQEVQAFITELLNRHPSQSLGERLLRRLEQEQIFRSLNDGLAHFSALISQSRSSARWEKLGPSFVEALDTVLLTAAEALHPEKPDQIDWLLRLTDDRSEMMKRIRQTFLAEEAGFSAEEKMLLLDLTNLFARLIWLLRQLGQLLDHAR